MSAPRAPKLSGAQICFMRTLDGRGFVRRRERDGTVMPWLSEGKTVTVLVRLGLIKWVNAGEDGYIYNGVVPTEAGHAAIAKATGQADQGSER